MPVFVRVLAVDLGNKVANESLLVECGKVGAQEVVPDSVQALMVELHMSIVIEEEETGREIHK